MCVQEITERGVHRGGREGVYTLEQEKTLTEKSSQSATIISTHRVQFRKEAFIIPTTYLTTNVG